MPTTTLLDEAIEAWGDARQGVIAEARNIPPSAFDFRPRPEMRSVAELVSHIVETGVMWWNELTRPTADFTRKSFPALIRHYASDVSRVRSGCCSYVRRFDGEFGTRLSWMHHGIAHEEYHRAQIAFYARLLGRTPALTRLIHGG